MIGLFNECFPPVMDAHSKQPGTLPVSAGERRDCNYTGNAWYRRGSVALSGLTVPFSFCAGTRGLTDINI